MAEALTDHSKSQVAPTVEASVFRLQVISDLHLEQLSRKNKRWKEKLVQPVCDVVAVLGDVCELQHEDLWLPFLAYLAQNWKTVLVVNGNHEYHNDDRTSVAEWQRKQREGLRPYPNVVVLENSEFVAHTEDGRPVVVWGATFWSYVPDSVAEDVQERIRDYHCAYVDEEVAVPGEIDGTTDQTTITRRLRCRDTNAWHEASVRALYERVHREPDTHLIVLTHHAPLRQNTAAPQYERNRHRALNAAFASDQSGLFRPNVKLWAFGHTHFHTDFRYRDTRVLSNPHGYGALDDCGPSYRPNWVVEVVV